MSLVVGDLDNDGEEERIVFEPYRSSSLLSSETALLFVCVAAIAAATACCWCAFYVASKRKRLVDFLHRLHAHGHAAAAEPQPAADQVKAPPARPLSDLDYAHYLQPHLSAYAPPHLPPLPRLPPSAPLHTFHPAGFKDVAHVSSV
ncbi:uncharacterized protein LOC144155587 [Haemaphysalis longicornis]